MSKLLLGLATVFSMSAFAGHYGDAGCGLGSVVFGDKPGIVQVFAATTNGSSANQSFGITSGTSNCTAEKGMAKRIPMYIEVNRLVLAKEAARGEGEILYGLARLMGCNTQKFGTTLKSNYNQIFVESQMQAAGIEARINERILRDRQSSCGA